MNALAPIPPAEHLCLHDLVHSGAIVGERRTGPRRAWTTREIKILRENYGTVGLAGCLPLLPGRSAGAIYQHAGAEGLASPQAQKSPRGPRWAPSEHIDAVIRREYLARTHRGAVDEIARIVARPAWWVSRRAVHLGLTQARRKEPVWSEEEEAFAAQHAAKSFDAIARMMQRRGWKRSATAISVKLKRLGQTTGRDADGDHFTGHALAAVLGVDPTTVTRWIGLGLLSAKRRKTGATKATTEGDFWIPRAEARRFILDNVAVIDIRKVEKFGFLDLVGGRISTGGAHG